MRGTDAKRAVSQFKRVVLYARPDQRLRPPSGYFLHSRFTLLIDQLLFEHVERGAAAVTEQGVTEQEHYATISLNFRVLVIVVRG